MSSEQDRVMIRDGDLHEVSPFRRRSEQCHDSSHVAIRTPCARGQPRPAVRLACRPRSHAAEAATTFRWRWQKISGPVITPGPKAGARASPDRSATTWEKGSSAAAAILPLMERYDNGKEIATAPYGCDRPERWRLRCITESE
jgi:hypothetical protein